MRQFAAALPLHFKHIVTLCLALCNHYNAVLCCVLFPMTAQATSLLGQRL
jgi:hypothetical protein